MAHSRALALLHFFVAWAKKACASSSSFGVATNVVYACSGLVHEFPSSLLLDHVWTQLVDILIGVLHDNDSTSTKQQSALLLGLLSCRLYTVDRDRVVAVFDEVNRSPSLEAALVFVLIVSGATDSPGMESCLVMWLF